MSPLLKRAIPLLVVLALLLPAGIYFAAKRFPAPKTAPAEAPSISPALSILGEPPDWTSLEKFQNTITREDFERLLTTVFTVGEKWKELIEIDETAAHIRIGTPEAPDVFHLRFATPTLTRPTPRGWKSTVDLPPAPPGKPLDGLHIAIDPGHIGGSWAKIEARWFVVGEGTPVCEGDMTLQVTQLLKPRLEALGAKVSLVRTKAEPITPLRPESLLSFARDSGEPTDSPAALQRIAERLFYRTAEIRARAQLVNDSIKPDLVLCLHFNADAWGDPTNPTLVDRSHLHFLLNGGYNDEEIALADQRFSLLKKLLRRTHEEEALVASSVANTFAEVSGLPPFIYPPDSPNARPVNDNPYLWARNLLANRLYDCPVIFAEPYVMNSTIDYPRIQAGDYEGTREINGQQRPSIFREYADALTQGLANHYQQSRKPAE